MNICAPLINEFWKEYYQRTQQQNNPLQQTTLNSTQNDPLKQLNHIQQNAKIDLEQNQHIPQQEHTTLVPFSQSTPLGEQTTQASVNQHGSKDGEAQQNSLVPSMQQQSQTQTSSQPEGHQEQQQQQTFQSVSQVNNFI